MYVLLYAGKATGKSEYGIEEFIICCEVYKNRNKPSNQENNLFRQGEESFVNRFATHVYTL